MKDPFLYENMIMPDIHFPIRLFKLDMGDQQQAFSLHWHEQIEFLYFISGNARVVCNAESIEANPGDLVVVNSNDLHSGENIAAPLTYYVIIIDISLLHSSFPDTCQTKYITPICQNLILFKNRVHGDRAIEDCIRHLIEEYRTKQTGYELAVKSYIYRLFVLLMRNHVKKVLSKSEYDVRVKKLERLAAVLDYIHNSYAENIAVEQLASIANVSKYHFCRLFRQALGKTPIDYINSERLRRAELLLENSGMNITEIALNTGFNDVNYFSRLFKKYKKVSPKEFRRKFAYNGCTGAALPPAE